MNESDSDPPRRWYEGGLRFECTRSGRCCRAHGRYDRVYLDDGDARALARHLGLSLSELERRYCWFEDGWRLLRFERRACVFLDRRSGECSIYPARPRQCRTWPFWPQNLDRRVWEREIAPFCPGVGRGRLYRADEIERIAAEAGEEEEGCGEPPANG